MHNSFRRISSCFFDKRSLTHNAPDMSVELENTFTAVSQKAFLSNSQNKENFIDLLVVPLEAEYHTVVKSTGYYIFYY